MVEKVNRENIVTDGRQGEDAKKEEDSKEKKLWEFDDATNPVRVRWNFTTVDWIKMGLLSITLVPIRMLVLFFALVLSWIAASIGLIGMDQTRPPSSYRRTISVILTYLGQLCCKCVGFQVKKIGHQVSKDVAPVLAVAPHSSFFDGLAVFYSGLPYIISRSENRKIPFIGKCIEFSQAIGVDREDPQSRYQTVREIVRRVQSDEPWPQFIIFPEGSTSNRKALMSFKPGGFVPGRPVQPVLIRYKNKHDTVSWTWDQPHGAIACFFATICQWQYCAELEFLPPYKPSEEEVLDSKLFANNVRNLMATELGIPLCDVTFSELKEKYGKKTKRE
jgi:lysophosphatidylcholine acyltransferase/lyso-PAF acetyltransferase